MSEEKLIRSIYLYVAYFIALVLGIVGSFIIVKAVILNSFVPLSSAKEREIGGSSLVFCNSDIRRDRGEGELCENDKKRQMEGWYKRELVTGFSYLIVSILVIAVNLIVSKRFMNNASEVVSNQLQLEAPVTKEIPVKMVKQIKSQPKKRKSKK